MFLVDLKICEKLKLSTGFRLRLLRSFHSKLLHCDFYFSPLGVGPFSTRRESLESL